MDGKEIQTEILRNKVRTLSAMVYPICDELNVQPVHAVLLLLLELHLISNAQNIITVIVNGDQHETKTILLWVNSAIHQIQNGCGQLTKLRFCVVAKF